MNQNPSYVKHVKRIAIRAEKIIRKAIKKAMRKAIKKAMRKAITDNLDNSEFQLYHINKICDTLKTIFPRLTHNDYGCSASRIIHNYHQLVKLSPENHQNMNLEELLEGIKQIGAIETENKQFLNKVDEYMALVIYSQDKHDASIEEGGKGGEAKMSELSSVKNQQRMNFNNLQAPVNNFQQQAQTLIRDKEAVSDNTRSQTPNAPERKYYHGMQ